MLLATLSLLLTVEAHPAGVEENRQIVRKAVQLYEKGFENNTKFFYQRRREVSEFESGGRVKSKSSTTVRREAYEGLVVQRVVARNDQPLSPEEQAKQQERIKTDVAAFRSRGPQTAAARKRGANEEMQLMKEFPEAFDFTRIANESVNGRPTDVYDFQPRPGYSPKSFKFKMFEKVKGRMWIDAASGEMARVDAEAFDTISVGFGILGKVGKGATFSMVRQEAAPGLWVMEHQRMKIEVRVMLVKSIRQEEDLRFSDYKPR
ncbi:MAG: hypothetical protein HYZ37_11980 [Candidatus Solibacter usitatus]|nr:hypothetical protein [Candidatus Solibacter usitatus]